MLVNSVRGQETVSESRELLPAAVTHVGCSAPSSSLGRRLCNWKLHQTHPDCRERYYVFHSAAAKGEGGGNPS